jgi:hypothetical protein
MERDFWDLLKPGRRAQLRRLGGMRIFPMDVPPKNKMATAFSSGSLV